MSNPLDRRTVEGDSPSAASVAAESIQPTNGTGENGGHSQALASTTVTITESPAEQQITEDILTLTLRARPSVTWDESVVNNEGLGRKSSKRCCIFHKQRPFGESSTDSSGCDSDSSEDDEGEDKKPRASQNGPRKIARPKKGKDVVDFQRYHA